MAQARVIALVAANSAIPVGSIHPESRLLHDLGVDGDDAVELIIAISEQFGMQAEDFPFSEYFSGEPSVGWRWLPWIRRARRRLRPLTVQDVVAAVTQADWRVLR